VGLGVLREGTGERPLSEGGGQVVDELSRGDEERIEAVLDGAVGDGHGQVGLAAAWLPMRMRLWPSVTKSGEKAGPSSDRRTVDW
jgi:hypothetical protein